MLNLYQLERQAAGAAGHEPASRRREHIVAARDAAGRPEARRQAGWGGFGLLLRLGAIWRPAAKVRPLLP